MKQILRIFGRMLLGVVILAVLSVAAVLVYARVYLPRAVAPRSFPQTDGEVMLPGLDAPVDIYRDGQGVAHIYASSAHDLFFAQGFVHAQERFWQMDTWRHIGSGRLAEMFGATALETDSFLRTLGWRQASERDLAGYAEDSRAMLEAYAQGVNAYIGGRKPVELSLEYAVLSLLNPSYQIAPWEPIHSVTWGRAMAWDLRGNLDEEIERAVLLKTLGADRVDELFPPYPADHPTIVRGIPSFGTETASSASSLPQISDELLAAVSHNASLLDGLLGPGGNGKASNSWVLAGSRTASGKPLFANDPHLSAQMPSIWYQVDMHCRPKTDACPYSFAGFSFAGVPGIVVGHNDDIVWGMSTVSPDVMDLFIERVNPQNPDQYEVKGEWVDFDVRTETIQVAGSEPLELRVRTTRHGPVISDVYGPLKDVSDGEEDFTPFRERAGVELPDEYVISLAWTALTEPVPLEAVWNITRAKNWDEFRLGASEFRTAPQNLLYADVRGNIGYQMPGDYPVRASGDGRFPVPGWTGEYDWTGYVPFEELPYAFNPPEGYIVAANNKVPPEGYPHLISTDWNYGFRAQQIADLIAAAPEHADRPYMQRMQFDGFDPMSPVLVPLVLDAVAAQGGPGEALGGPALEVLAGWGGGADADSAGAAVFEAFWNHLLAFTFNDELPEEFPAEGGDRWAEVVRNIAHDEHSPWWDDITTEAVVETRDDMLVKAFDAAVDELGRRLGRDPEAWKWGDLHTITFRNTALGDSGIGLIEDLFNRGPFPVSGGENILNATGWNAGESYEVDWLPSFRMIVDLADMNSAVTVHTTGQSGHAYHPQYVDLARLWAAGEYYPMLWSESEVVAASPGHLVLRP